MRPALLGLSLLAAGCSGKVEDYPRSDTPLGVGAHETPPDGGDDSGSAQPDDTGDEQGDDTGGPQGDDTGA